MVGTRKDAARRSAEAARRSAEAATEAAKAAEEWGKVEDKQARSEAESETRKAALKLAEAIKEADEAARGADEAARGADEAARGADDTDVRPDRLWTDAEQREAKIDEMSKQLVLPGAWAERAYEWEQVALAWAAAAGWRPSGPQRARHDVGAQAWKEKP